MPTQTFRSRIEAPAGMVFDWHKRPGAFQRLTPPWSSLRVKSFEGIQEGERAVLHVGLGPARLTWIAEHRDYVEGRRFKDVQVKGPFRTWEHTHRVEPDGPEACTLTDHLEYDPPLGKLMEDWLEDRLEQAFAYRHRIVEHDLKRHRAYAGQPLRIAITGSTGLIGSALTHFLTSGGHEVIRLVRSRPAAGEVYWNPREGAIEAEKLEGLDALIHLAGENVFALRWTGEKKRRILQSRASGTRLLAETLAKLKTPPAVLVSVSGISYYGDRGSEILTETSEPGESGFMMAVTKEWEAACQPAADAGIRVVHPRMSPVLSPAGGMLQFILPFFKMGLGGSVGSGDQYMSWIGLDDVVYGLYHAIWTDSLKGPVNFAAPDPRPMSSFTKTLARVIERPSLLTVPASILRILSGEVADEMVLASTRVHPQRLLETGYTFTYPGLREALRHQLGYMENDD